MFKLGLTEPFPFSANINANPNLKFQRKSNAFQTSAINCDFIKITSGIIEKRKFFQLTNVTWNIFKRAQEKFTVINEHYNHGDLDNFSSTVDAQSCCKRFRFKNMLVITVGNIRLQIINHWLGYVSVYRFSENIVKFVTCQWCCGRIGIGLGLYKNLAGRSGSWYTELYDSSKTILLQRFCGTLVFCLSD